MVIFIYLFHVCCRVRLISGQDDIVDCSFDDGKNSLSNNVVVRKENDEDGILVQVGGQWSSVNFFIPMGIFKTILSQGRIL